MVTSQSTLEKALEEEITRIEQEKKEIAAQIRQFNRTLKDFEQKLLDYRAALNSARTSSSKSRKARFHASPQQLIAQIFKQTPSTWLNLEEITRQAMVLDGQDVGEDLPLPQLQTVTCSLYYLGIKALVEKQFIDGVAHWRLKPLRQG